MADINQVITLGIGTPAGVPEFLTFGLQIGAVVVPADFVLSGNVAVRLTASDNVAIRQTASGNVAIRQTMTGDVEL